MLYDFKYYHKKPVTRRHYMKKSWFFFALIAVLILQGCSSKKQEISTAVSAQCEIPQTGCACSYLRAVCQSVVVLYA